MIVFVVLESIGPLTKAPPRPRKLHVCVFVCGGGEICFGLC